MTGGETKKELRKRMLAKRAAMAPDARKLADEAINRIIIGLEAFLKAPLVAGYVSDGTEPDLAECLAFALKSGRRVCLPRTSVDGSYGFAEVGEFPGGLIIGKYGLKEPKQEAKAVGPEDLKKALWLVPGVAFDGEGGRLGRGKGVYDRLLAEGCGQSIGVFYECQNCASLPKEGHDLDLDLIVTESGVRGASLKRKGETER